MEQEVLTDEEDEFSDSAQNIKKQVHVVLFPVYFLTNIQHHQLGNTLDDHAADRKKPRKMAIHHVNLYPSSAERVCGNTLYVNLYNGQQIIQYFQVSTFHIRNFGF